MAHAGFDRLTYPGDHVMQLLWDNTNLAWTGFYLTPAPSQKYTGWMSKFRLLKSMGWGFAPLYVGQQAQGPGSHVLTALQGTFDGIDATNLAARAGFPGRSVIYLDIEQGPPLGRSAGDYYRAWVQEVFNQGYYPGVYCSYLIASQLMAIDMRPAVWVFHLKYPSRVYHDPFPQADPMDSGYVGASLWQLAQKCSIAFSNDRGVTQILSPVDLDSADCLDPSNFLGLAQTW